MNLFALTPIIILLDIITLWGIKKTFPNFCTPRWKVICIAFFIQVLFSLLIVLIGFLLEHKARDYRMISMFYYLIGIIATIYVPKLIFSLFLLADKIISALSLLWRRHSDDFPRNSRGIIARCGFWVSILFIFMIIWGMIFGRYNYKVEHVDITINDLPSAFNGYKILQISDIHAGNSDRFVKTFQKAVKKINDLEPHLIVFTGDMVNNFSEEAIPIIPVFSQLKARDGKFAVLGNHDYGGYYEWNSQADSIADHNMLQDYIEQMGFVILNNRSVIISRYNFDRMALIGIESYGFNEHHPKQGDLEVAMESIHNIPLKVLLSHDPSFWPEKVEGKTDIDLTLSGHSHGMQIGFRLGKHLFSPAPLLGIYNWAGLYQTGNQFLYVNRGLGAIVYPGRIGMTPEITLITLWKDKLPELQ